MNHLTPKFDTCFFERYAMITLATLMGEHYSNLINRDRPDLQDPVQGIGIEVTRAIAENKNVAHALVNEMAGEAVMEVNAADLSNIRQRGYAYGLGNGQMMGAKEYTYWSLAMPMQRVLESKMDKVNLGYYGDFQEFGLFVFSKENLNAAQVRHTVDFVINRQTAFSRRYARLFVSQIETLFVCDLVSGRFNTLKIGPALRRRFYESAISQ